MILYSKLWQGLKFFSLVSLGPLCLQGNKFDLVRSSGDSARTLTPSADVGKVPFAERRHRYPRARTRRAVGRYCYMQCKSNAYDYISHPHVSAGGAGWGSLYSYTTYAVLDNSTRLRVVNMLLCDAAEGLRKATTCAGIPMRRMATPGPRFRVSSVHELFRSWFRFKGSCSFTGFTGALGPGRISAKRSTSAFNTPLEGAEFACCFSHRL